MEQNRWQQFNSIIDSEELNLKEKGLLLILFRYINHEKGYASPSRALIKKLFGTNKNDVLDKYMNSLIEKGYLKRISGKGVRTKYYIYAKVGTQIEPSTEIEPRVGTQIEPSSRYSKRTTKRKEKENKKNIYIDLTFVDDVVKIERVNLTQEQYDTLKANYGESELHNVIVSLETYIANDKKYTDHYLTLNNWLRNNKSKNNIIYLNNNKEPIPRQQSKAWYEK